MHRIDSDGHISNLFTEGNPSLGVPATVVSDDWLNDVQENICNYIESRSIALVKGNYNQLQAAIEDHFNSYQLEGSLAVRNLGIDLSAGVFKMVDNSGNDLSSVNKASVTITSNTPGQIVTLFADDANHTFEDQAASSDIIGEEFGTEAGIAWGNVRPFFIYAVNSDDTDAGLEFAISPNPNASESPGTTNIGYHGNPASTPSDNNFFFLTSANVTATHNNKPCLLIGSIRMTKDASDDWTIAALSSQYDGIGKYQEGNLFDMPTGQNEAVAGSFIRVANTPPTWSSPGNILYKYFINKEGEVRIIFDTLSAGNCANGSNAEGMDLVLPYPIHTNYNSQYQPVGRYVVTSAPSGSGGGAFLRFQGDDKWARLSGGAETDGFQDIEANDWTSASDDLSVHFNYKAF